MPGGNPAAWPHVKEIFQAIAAKVDDGTPCCDWVGEERRRPLRQDGPQRHRIRRHAADLRGLHQLLKDGLGLSAEELHEVFAEWNKGELDSYLIEITADIFAKKDDDGAPLVDKILDTAGQKGTGKWTGISALDLGMPVTLIGEAVFARCLSAMKDERVAASKVLTGPKHSVDSVDRKAFIEDVRRALYCSKMISYAQGYMLLREAAKDQGWNLNYRRHRPDVARRLHHPQPLPGQDQGSLRQEPEAHQPAARRFLQQDAELATTPPGAAPSFRRSSSACRRPPSRRRSPSTTATAPRACPPTCCRPSATSSAPTPTSASISRAASSSTPTGPAAAAASRPVPITPDL